MDKHNTKERIAKAALILFADNGYDAVKITDIAQAVGLAPSALYKHYENKQVLFDAIFDKSIHIFRENTLRQISIVATSREWKTKMANITEDYFVEVSRDYFLQPVQDKYISSLRKLMVVEQFRRPDLAKMYDEHYFEMQFNLMESILSAVPERIKPDVNINVAAIQYVTVISSLISFVDRNPDRIDEALGYVENHARQFYKLYIN